MKEKHTKQNKNKILIFLFIIFIIGYFYNNYNKSLDDDYNKSSKKSNSFFSTLLNLNNNDEDEKNSKQNTNNNDNKNKKSFLNFGKKSYEIIKQDQNPNYDGKGQRKVSNEVGYFTTFETSGTNSKTYKEYKQNGDSPWKDNPYWDGTMEDSGCGITTLSIILSGYNKNYTPEDLRQKYYPSLNYDRLSKELSNTFKIKNSDFYYDSVHLSKETILGHLRSSRPIIACIWNNPKENRWTTSSHYMALLAADNNDLVYVSNPNGGVNDSKSSGWYNINDILPYLAKVMFIESY